jgi:hypothetical protein
MRIWGRVNQVNGQGGTWQIVQTDANGRNDYVYATNLIQVLKLNLGESPFYADRGIPAQQSVMTQLFPDYYTYQTQKQFRQYFVSLAVSKVASPTPTYDITAVTHSGTVIQESIPA